MLTTRDSRKNFLTASHAATICPKPTWLSHFEAGLKIPRRKACRFDSGPGHHSFLAAYTKAVAAHAGAYRGSTALPKSGEPALLLKIAGDNRGLERTEPAGKTLAFMV